MQFDTFSLAQKALQDTPSMFPDGTKVTIDTVKYIVEIGQAASKGSAKTLMLMAVDIPQKHGGRVFDWAGFKKQGIRNSNRNY
jgi:hypothetical protein